MDTKEIRQAICLRLNINQLRYNELIFETGEEYFKWRCNGFEKALQAFRTSREMWHWWKVQYTIIDGHLLTDKQPFNLAMYRACHIGLEYFPHEAIVKKAMGDYEKVVQDIINKSSPSPRLRGASPPSPRLRGTRESKGARTCGY